MKVINYKRYMYSLFDCSIHGRILISQAEYKKLYKLLDKMPVDVTHPWIKRMAKEDIAYGLGATGRLFNIRVPATEYIVANMSHAGNLKRGNYYFEIVRGGK